MPSYQCCNACAQGLICEKYVPFPAADPTTPLLRAFDPTTTAIEEAIAERAKMRADLEKSIADIEQLRLENQRLRAKLDAACAALRSDDAMPGIKGT